MKKPSRKAAKARRTRKDYKSKIIAHRKTEKLKAFSVAVPILWKRLLEFFFAIPLRLCDFA
jgi:hypothetical protein